MTGNAGGLGGICTALVGSGGGGWGQGLWLGLGHGLRPVSEEVDDNQAPRGPERIDQEWDTVTLRVGEEL